MMDQGEKNAFVFLQVIVVCWAMVIVVIQVADLTLSQACQGELENWESTW